MLFNSKSTNNAKKQLIQIILMKSQRIVKYLKAGQKCKKNRKVPNKQKVQNISLNLITNQILKEDKKVTKTEKRAKMQYRILFVNSYQFTTSKGEQKCTKNLEKYQYLKKVHKIKKVSKILKGEQKYTKLEKYQNTKKVLEM